MRTSRTNGTKTYNYIYNGSTLSQMTVGSDTLYFTYDASGRPLSVSLNGTTYYYATNLQGDVTAILNTSGTAVVNYTYDAWGNPLTTTGDLTTTLGALNPLRYRGYVYDTETGLYYLQSRYYDPQIGRFINADALVSNGQGILGNNMFAYCNNNPTNYFDPSGNCGLGVLDRNSDQFSTCCDNCLGGIAVLGGTVAVGIATGYLLEQVKEWINEQMDAITNQLAASLARTKKREYRTEYEEHHITARRAKNAAEAAAILNDLLDGGVEHPLNKVLIKTSVHRRIHTNTYYLLANYLVIGAYHFANGDPQQQYTNVVSALNTLRIFLEGLNAIAIN